MGQILLEQVTPNHTQDMKEFAINERVMARAEKAYRGTRGNKTDQKAAWEALLGNIFEEGLLDGQTTDPQLPAMLSHGVAQFGLRALADEGGMTEERIE